MTRYEVYIGNDDRLRVIVYNSDNNQQQLTGVNAYNCIRSLYNSKILGVNENDTDAILRFKNCTLMLNEYDNIFEIHEFRELFIPILINYKKYEEKRKISDLKKKRVKRKNKYGTKKIIITGLLTFFIGITSMNALNGLGVKSDVATVFTDNVNTIEFSNDENNMVYSFDYDSDEEYTLNYLDNVQKERCAYISYEDRTETENR